MKARKREEERDYTVFLPAFVVLNEVRTVANFFEHLDFFEKTVARNQRGGSEKTGRWL